MFIAATTPKNLSSLQFSKQVGITQKIAWFILQRLAGLLPKLSERAIPISQDLTA